MLKLIFTFPEPQVVPSAAPMPGMPEQPVS